ncbi:MAG: hypothetical protein ACLUVC_02155 [Longibaculum sp.]
MAGTFLGFPFDDEIFLHEWGQAPDPVLTAILQSGAVVMDSKIQKMIENDGNVFTIPFYNVLSGKTVNYDGETDITATETDGGSQTGVVFGRATAHTARDFIGELIGNDPMGNIARGIARFWNKQNQSELLNILNAVLQVSGTTAGYAKTFHETHILDKSSSTAVPYEVGETDANDLATQALGDNKGLFSLAIMHSNVAKTLENKKLLEYWKYTDANGIQKNLNIANWNGYVVIIDDGVGAKAVGGSGENKGLIKYPTYLLGTGVIRMAHGKVKVPAEIARDAYKNGGQETLITRERLVLHPNGFSFDVTKMASESPTFEELGNKANWDIKFDPKSIPMAVLYTNG